MGRQSITERYDQLAARGAELAAHAPAVSPVHAQTVAVLRKLLTMGTKFSSDKVPMPLRAMMRTLERMEPVLVSELANVPPAAIREFLGELIAEMQTIVDTPEEDHAAPGDAGPAVSQTA